MTARGVAVPDLLPSLVRAQVRRAVAVAAQDIGPVARSKVARVVRALVELLSSRTFLLFVSGPFTGWGVALYVFDGQHSSELQRLVTGGPSAVFALWFVASSVWGASAAIVGRYRHAVAVWLALLVLAVVLEGIVNVTSRSKVSSAPVCREEQCVAL